MFTGYTYEWGSGDFYWYEQMPNGLYWVTANDFHAKDLSGIIGYKAAKNREKALAQYPTDGEFKDPMLRCAGCHRVVVRKKVEKIGCCPKCEHRKMQAIFGLSPHEHRKVAAKFPRFARCFVRQTEDPGIKDDKFMSQPLFSGKEVSDG